MYAPAVVVCQGLDRCITDRVPALYWWRCEPSGNVVALCAECCAGWWRNAAEDPGLVPSRVWDITR